MLKPPQGIDFSGLFSPFDLTSHHQVVAAVSGGSDSTALLLLLKRHLDEYAPDVRLVAVTIDHALRHESASEAGEVARLCASIGVAHQILTWTGRKPATGIAAAAREARHELLAEAAQSEKAACVLTGHTADDQAETVLMRQARDAAEHGGRGVAGIAPATLFDGRVWFARPLLSTRRETLREFLRERRVGWIDDPTNTNENYERPRLRKELGVDGGEARFAGALATAAEAAPRRENLGREAAKLIEAHVDRPAPGLLRLNRDFFHAGGRDASIYALRILLATAGGTPHPPDDARAATLHARLAGDKPVRTVLSRALAVRRKAGVFLLREARGLPRAGDIREGSVWDGRYRIVAGQSGGDACARAAGQTSAREPVPDSLLRAAAAGQPELPATLAAVPVVAPWRRYLPSFDLAPARATARLVGAPPIPTPPFQEHD